MSGDESLGRLPTGGWVPAGWRAGAAADHGVCCRTLASSACSSRPGSSPSYLGQDVPDPAVRGQRVGLAAASVQRGDQRVPEALAQRMQLDERFELPGHVAAGPQLDPGREVILEQSEADLFQTGPVRLQPGTVTGVDQHVTAEERERLPGQPGGAGQIAALPQVACCRGEGDDPQCVDPAWLDVQGVSAGPAGDHTGNSECPAQLGHLRLQRVPARCGRDVGPQVVDEPVSPDRGARVDREPDKHLRRLSRRQRQHSTVAADLDRAEHRDTEHPRSLRRRPVVSSASDQRQRLRRC